MLLCLLLFLILAVWGLKDNDIYWREAAGWSTLVVVAAGCTFIPSLTALGIVALVVIDVVLLLRVVGSDVVIS